ncbi:MAG: FxSxx-COOH system tetratricopeptide repeat protein [Trebonia sp.]
MTAEPTRETAGVDARTAGPRRPRPIWGSEIPFRNPSFTGRVAELQALREQLRAGVPAVLRQPPSVFYGLGGVGKTELAAEYAHQFSRDYDIVWWVRSDQEDSIRASLVALGRRLGLAEVSADQRDYSFRVVIDALQAGEPTDRWLLIFDDVTRPGVIRRYLPQGTGHVIVTSRIAEWHQELRTEGIEIREFPLTESVQFLRKRVPELAYPAAGGADPETEAARQRSAEDLATALGNLPLALEHAASYLAQTGTLVADYIEDFTRDARELLSRGADTFTNNIAVATTWSLSRNSISPAARELFQLLAFFSAEPVSEEVFVPLGHGGELPEGLRKVLASRTELKRAQRELARFSLVQVDGVRNIAQVHRVVQAVTRGRIELEDPAAAATLRETVHHLLAASDPGSPEKEQNDPFYERSIHHLVPSGAIESANPALRNLITNQVRRLHLRGGYLESLSLGEDALHAWQRQYPEDDIQTLALAVEVGVAMRQAGRVTEAFDLNVRTLALLLEHHGPTDETYLTCANSYGQDLRLLGRYDDALAHDLAILPAYEEVFNPGQHRRLNLRNNIALDLRCVGRYQEALGYDRDNAAERERYFGRTNQQTMSSNLGVSRDLRRLGQYEDALALARDLENLMEARDAPWNFFHLDVYGGLSVALRRVGFYAQGHAIAEEVYRRQLALCGPEHRATLFTSINLVCDRRVVDELAGAQELGEQTVLAWQELAGNGHPNTLAARANLAAVLRMRGNPVAARDLNTEVLAGFRQLYAYDHPSTLVVMTNLASDHAAVGAVMLAREIGEQALAASRTVRGPKHPATMAAAANLSLDVRATGDEEAARQLYTRTLAAYEEQLTLEHPQARRAAQLGRINVDIEPMSW